MKCEKSYDVVQITELVARVEVSPKPRSPGRHYPVGTQDIRYTRSFSPWDGNCSEDGEKNWYPKVVTFLYIKCVDEKECHFLFEMDGERLDRIPSEPVSVCCKYSGLWWRRMHTFW